MHRWTRRGRSTQRLVAVIVTCAVTCIPVLSTPSAWASESESVAPLHYVALGDSRAAAPTRASQLVADGCGRTSNGYPNLVAAALNPASFVDVSCGGAITADVVDRGQITNPPVRRRVPVQASALRPDTGLVTLSIGGNDLRWRGLITPCFGSPTITDRDCRDNPALPATIDSKFAALATSLDHVLAVIRERSPLARIVVVGHGGYFGPQGCRPDAELSPGDAAFVARFFAGFDNVLAGSARRNNATYVDVASAAVGHDACAPAGERWFTGSVPRGETPSNHPTPAGSATMARLVLAAIGG